jgi:hypothetical protein
LAATTNPSYFIVNVNRPLAYRSLARRFPQTSQPAQSQSQATGSTSASVRAAQLSPSELDRELLKTVFGQVFQETAKLPHSAFLSDR